MKLTRPFQFAAINTIDITSGGEQPTPHPVSGCTEQDKMGTNSIILLGGAIHPKQPLIESRRRFIELARIVLFNSYCHQYAK